MKDGERFFYQAALSIGAKIADADGNPDSMELERIKRFFSLDIERIPDAATIYNKELHRPRAIETVAEPFREFFHSAPEVGETFLFGMCQVALADGKVDSNEIKVLVSVGKIILQDERTLFRVLKSAGILKDARDNSEDNKGPAGKRREMLSILGLLSNATDSEIDQEYRRLAKRYHPDRLNSLGMPRDEIHHAEKLLREVNDAYAFLRKR